MENNEPIKKPDYTLANDVRLVELFERIHDGTYRNIHSILLVKNDQIVLEEYFPGRDSHGNSLDASRDFLHELRSVSKTINSILIGIAIDQKLIGGVDEKIADLFPDYAALLSASTREDLRLKHLLTMTAGLQWEEWAYLYSDPRNDAVALSHCDDFIRFQFEKPVVALPGAKFEYSGAIALLLGELIHRRSKIPTAEFAQRYLFEPLGITDYRWRDWRPGILDTSSGLALRPRDMTKLGSLFLHGGRWQGKQIVSESWVAESTKNYVDARQFPSWIKADGYGYQWWLRSFQLSDQTIPSYHAAGRGGQFIFVFPTLQLIAVFTGWNHNTLGTQPFDLLPRHILPAVIQPSPNI